MFDLTLSEQAMVFVKEWKVYCIPKAYQSVQAKRSGLSVSVWRDRCSNTSRDAKLVKEDIVVMDAIGVENVEENEKYNFLLSC